MKDTKRALRRHHRARMYKIAEARLSHWKFYPNCVGEKNYTEENKHRIISITRDNMTVCSCWMCCNERSNLWSSAKLRLTFAERRNIDSFNDQMKDLDI